MIKRRDTLVQLRNMQSNSSEKTARGLGESLADQGNFQHKYFSK